MPETPAFLAERLKSEGEKTAAFFSTMADECWSLPVYSEGETWTVRSILAHFLSSEHELLRLLADIRDGGPGAREDFDLDRYNASQLRKTAQLSPQALLDQFLLARAATVAFVSTLEQADLEKRGRHPYLGPTTLVEMVKIVYRHNQIHTRDLRHALPD